MAVGYEDAAIGRRNHIIGLIELVRTAACLARGAETHQQLTVRAELVHLLSLGALCIADEVSDPDVAIRVDVDAMRGDHDAATEVRKHLTGIPVKFEYRVDGIVIAVDRYAAAKAAGAAAFVCPYVSVVGIDVYAGGGTPFTAFGQIAPIGRNDRCRVRDAIASDEVALGNGNRGQEDEYQESDCVHEHLELFLDFCGRG